MLYVFIQDTFCTLCPQAWMSWDILGDEKHLVFECPALQDLRNRFENLLQLKAPQGNAMFLFMWQDDIIGFAPFLEVDACLEKVYTSAGPPVGDQASDQP